MKRLREGLMQLLGRLFLHIKVLINKIPSKRSVHYDIIIVKVCLIGDFVMSYDPLMEMKKAFKGKRVLLICPQIVKPFLENDELYKDIIVYDLRSTLRLRNWVKFSSILRNVSADVVYYPEWQRFEVGDLIVNALKANVKIGMKSFDRIVNDANYFDHQYTRLIDYPKDCNEILQMQFYIRETINQDYVYGNNPMLVENICFDDIRKPFAVVSMSSSVEKKMWPIDRFADVINSLPRELTVVVTGAGNDDVVRAKELEKLVDKRGGLINYVNRTTLPELTSLIAQSLFVIGNDSSAVHLAAATRVPSICVHHGAHFNRFLPYPKGLLDNKYMPRCVYYKMDCYNCNYNCVKGDLIPYECLNRVTVDDVNQEIDKLLMDIGYPA